MRTKVKPKTISELIKECKFDYVNPHMRELFSLEPIRGTVEVRNFGKNMTSEEVIAELAKDGCVPANCTELLVYCAANMKIHKWIVALDSVVSFEGDRLVPRVSWYGAERHCSLDWFDLEFDGCDWFAFVRESRFQGSRYQRDRLPILKVIDALRRLPAALKDKSNKK